MASQWYYMDQGQRRGPLSSVQLKELADSGRLQPTDLLWKEGLAKWEAAGNVKGLFATATPPPLPLQPPAAHTSDLPPPLPPFAPNSDTSSSVEGFSPFEYGMAAPSSLSALQTGDTRLCEWCGRSIPRQSLKCPECLMWRKDIHQHRLLHVAFEIAQVIPFLFFMIGLFQGWWVEQHGFFTKFSIEKLFSSSSGIAIAVSLVVSMIAHFMHGQFLRDKMKIGFY
jgi:hypothetical protein